MRKSRVTILMVVMAAATVHAENGPTAWFEPGAGAVYNATLERYEVSPDTSVVIDVIADFAAEAMNIGAITVQNTDLFIPNQGVDKVGALNPGFAYSPFSDPGLHQDGTRANIVIYQVSGGLWFDDPCTPDVDESIPPPAGEALYSFEVLAGAEGTTITVDDLVGDINPYGPFPLATTFAFEKLTNEIKMDALQLFVVYSGDCPCPGDVSPPPAGDGQIDLEDLQAVAGILLQAGPPFVVPVGQGDCGDVNTDLQLDLEDLQAVAAILLNAGPPFVVPCE